MKYVIIADCILCWNALLGEGKETGGVTHDWYQGGVKSEKGNRWANNDDRHDWNYTNASLARDSLYTRYR